MKIPREIPSMRRTDNSLKEVMTNLCNQKNFRRVFLNQTIPVLRLFANQPTMVLLYFIYNADTNNMIYCTYEDIMQGLLDRKQENRGKYAKNTSGDKSNCKDL